jgi:flagellar protein FlaJ
MISYRGISTSLFGNLVEKFVSRFDFLKKDLLKADMKISYRVYMSIAFFSSFLALFLSIPIVFFLTFYFKLQLLQKMIILLLTPPAAFFITFICFCFYPSQKASSRRKNIETNLPFILAHMGSIASSGIPPHLVFKMVGKFKEYGEAAKEMEKIARNIESFGLDPISAIREVAKRTPSNALREFLFGFIATSEAGGNLQTYFQQTGSQAIFEWRMRRERFIRQLSTYAEIYVGILIAAPMMIISLLLVMAMIHPTIGGFTITQLLWLSTYLLIPAINLIFLIFLKGIEVEI